MFFTPWLRSVSRRIRFPKRRQKRLTPQQHAKMLRGPVVVSPHIEGLEQRCLMTIGPGLVSVTPNAGLFLTDGDVRTEAPRELVFQFSPGHIIDTTTLGAIEILRSGGDGTFGDGNEVAVGAAYADALSQAEPNKIVYRFASTPVNDAYRIVVHGTGPGPVLLSNLGVFGDTINDTSMSGADATLDFELDLGAQVIAVVPQPVTRGGGLSQNPNVIEVYFSDDDLTPAAATNPAFYQLIDTKGTAATTDDTISLPTGVTYDAGLDRAVLTYSSIPTGTHKLKIGSSQEGDSTTTTAVSLGTLFAGSGFTTTANLGDTSSGAGDADLYRFELSAGGTITVTATPSSTLNTFIELLDSMGTPVGGTTFTDNGVGTAETLTSGALAAGTYFARITSSGASTIGSYRLDIAVSNALVLNDDNSSYATATDLGVLGAAGRTLSAAITPQLIAIPALPGAFDEPGHRDLPFTAPLEDGKHGVGALTAPSAPSAIAPISYNFAANYGTLFGSPLINEISEPQKARTRELFELWSRDFGLQFVETAASGYQIVVGDPRASDPTIPPVDGVSKRFLTIVNSNSPNNEDSYGGGFMGILMHEIGHGLGLGHAGELQSFMGGGANGETLYTEHDAVHLRNIYPYFATDIDLYKFNVTQTGLFTAGTSAELRSTTSLLDSALTLFRDPFATTSSDFGSGGAVTMIFTSDSAGVVGNDIRLLINESPLGTLGVPTVSVSGHNITVTLDTVSSTTATQLKTALDSNAQAALLINTTITGAGGTVVTGLASGTTLALGGGNREVVSRNDDYNSNDAFISISLDPGTYYIGVSSTGNTSYDPTISDSGYGGNTDGAYDLQMSFTTAPASSLTDADNVGNSAASLTAQSTSLDGDADGAAGGDFNFWFQSGTTIFVDKTYVGMETGDISAPYNDIASALTKAASRIVAPVNGAAGITQGDFFTITDALNPTAVFEFDRTDVGGGVSGSNIAISIDPNDIPSVIATKIAAAINNQQAMGRILTTAVAVGDHVDVNPTNLVSLDVQGSHGLLTAPNLVRIVGNGGTDGNLATEADATPYVVGVSNSGATLVDGRTFDVPQGTTVMIDAGVVIKLQNANIDVGTDPDVIGPSRQDGALQILGTRKQTGTANNAVFLTSFRNDLIGGDSDGTGGLPTQGQWGGLIFRRDSDMNDSVAGDQDGGDFFLNSVYQADLSYGGGAAPTVFSTIHIVDERPTIAFSRITNSADAAISANPNSFDDSLDRIGPDIHGNSLASNSVNGLLVRIELAPNGQPADKLDVRGRFNDTDLTHVISDQFQITGNAGGAANFGSGLTARPGGRLQIDPGVVVKLSDARIEGERGSSQLIAEGTDSLPVIFTSLQDDRFGGASGTFDSSNNGFNTFAGNTAAKGDWGGLFFGQGSRINVDQSYIAYGGGNIPIAGGNANFAAIEAHEADLRLTNTTFEFNANGADGSARNFRTGNDASVVFIRGAQPIIINNTFHNNDGSVISIDANAMKAINIKDTGRTTGSADVFDQFANNQGPLVRLNRMANDIAGFNGVLGLEVRAAEITAEAVWDDTDIVHVVESGIFTIDNVHTVGGLRLQSAADASLVVKLGAGAGFNIGDPDKDGDNLINEVGDDGPLDIDDRIGGTMQIIGAPGFPVVLTSIRDDSVGASLDTRGFPQTDTNGDGIDIVNNTTGARAPDGLDDNTDLAFTGTQPAAGNWGEILFNKYAHDRNVIVVNEIEKPLTSGIDTNSRLVGLNDTTAEDLGNLAPNNKSANENRRAGFEIHGHIAQDDPTDVDIYKFVADAGTEIWLDIDFVDPALDTIVEFVSSNGTFLARSQDNTTLFSNGVTAPALPLQKSINLGEDYYGTTIRDGGMRLVTPGALGTTNTYFIRVRSNPAGDPDGPGPLPSNIEDLNGGLTSGQYQLQVRLGQRDETPGVAVKFADIRYATNGIHVKGLPYHSPLLGETTEFGTNDAANNTATISTAILLGNLLYSDRGSFSAGGTLTGATDIDFYKFHIDIKKIQEITGMNGGPQTWATVIDLDWADGLTRPDTTIAIFRQNGQLVYLGRESNVADDRPSTVPGSGSDIDDLNRGSVGSLDPYIGTAMFEEDPTANGIEFYYLAVVNNQLQPTALSANFLSTSGFATTTRLEPVTSVTRIAEDHIGFQGYTSNGTPVAPTTGPLIDISSSTALSTHVRPFSFQDVPLYVTGTVSINGLTRDQLFTVNPLTGNLTTRLDTNVDETDNGNQVQDLVMRSDGRLWAYRRSNTNNGVNTNNSTSGALVELESGITGTTQGNFISNVNDGIGSGSPAAGNFGNDVFEQVTNSDDVDALAFERNGTNNYNLYYSVRENGTSATTTGATTFNSKLYRANPTTGSAALGNPLGIQGDIQLTGTNPASGTLSFSSPNPSPTSFGNIAFQTRAQGTQANGVTLNITRTGGATQVNSASNGVINVQVNYDFTNNVGTTSIQTVVDVINASLGAQRIITAVATGTAGTLVTANVSGVASGGTDDASGRRIHGNVTGLAFGSFSNGTLFGVTSGEGVAGRGSQLIRITPGYGGGGGTATIIRDFSASAIGTTAANGFQGLALGPQNVANDAGVDAFYSNKLFAVTGDGRLVAMDAMGNGVIAFDSNNEVQTVSVTGTPTASSYFTLTFNGQTTDPIAFNAPGAVSDDEVQTTDVVAYNGTYTLSFVNDLFDTTSLVSDLMPGVTSFQVEDASGLPTVGSFKIKIGNEEMHVTSLSGTTLNGVTRNTNGTGDVFHGQNEAVFEVLTTNLNGALQAAPTTTLTVANIDNVTDPITFDVVDASVFPAAPFTIRIGAEEMFVTIRDTGLNQLTANRGVNGTAIASHTVGAAVTQVLAAQTILIDDETSFPTTPFNIRVDNEDMQVTLVGAGQFDVIRGINGTTIAAHGPNATVYRLITTAAGALNFNSTAAQVRTELFNAFSLAGVAVGGVPVALTDFITTFGPTGGSPTFLATPATIQFTGSLGKRDLFALTGDTTNLEGDERQNISLNAGFNNALTSGSGTYRLRFGGQNTGILNFNDSAAIVQAALNALSTIGGVGGAVTVTGSLPGTLSVQFGGTLQDTDVTALTVLDGSAGVQLTNNEVQQFSLTGAPTGGNFTLNLNDPANGFNNVNIGPIAFNANVAQIQTAFNTAFGGAGVVTVSLSAASLDVAGAVVTVVFDGAAVADRNILLMTLQANALTGGTTPSVFRSTLVDGNLQANATTTRAGSAVSIPVATTQDGNLSVYDALERLASIGPNDILVTGGDLPGTAVGVTFGGVFGGMNVNQLIVENGDGVTFGMLNGSSAAVATTGTIGDGQADNFIVSDATMSGATGLAFSPLDVNLWHPTTRRGQPDVAGHGINDPFDNSRHADEELQDITDEQGNTRTQTEGQGGASFYFGLEQRSGQYLNYESAVGQLGVINDEWQRDLTTSSNSATIANTYNVPGGAFGRLTTNTIDLSAYVANDKPTMYFNYYLDTNNHEAAQGSTAMRDSARVFASRDGGATWELVATNNTTLDAELAEYLSHSSSYFQSTLVQELFDTDQWRQARVDLSTFAGEATVSFRFDFATAGKIGEEIDPAAATLPGEEFGEFSAEIGDDVDRSAQRATFNQFEGFYIDDIIVGFAERGELVTNAPLDTSTFDNLYGGAAGFASGRADINNLSPAPTPITTGSYQFEVRRGTEYAAKSDPAMPRGDIAVNQTFDTNDPLIVSAFGQQPPLTENFDPAEFSSDPGFQTAAGTPMGADWFQTAVGSFPAGASLPNAFRSGVITAGEQSGVTLTLATAAGAMTFLAAVDAANFTTGGFGLPDTTTINGLKFLIDGVEQQFVISGTAIPAIPGAGPANGFVFPGTGTTTPAFVPLAFTIPGADGDTHTFEWRYVKGTNSTSFRADAAFIDDLFIPLPETKPLLGDHNVEREQGMVVLEGNFIRNVSGTGIIVEPGNRDSAASFPTNLPYGGAVRQTPVLNNTNRLVTHLALVNNVVTNFGAAGIQFSGDPNTGSIPDSAVPMGKLINNTIYGGGITTGGTAISGTGILITNNASPTLVNNIVANTALGISIDGTSGSTDITTTLFQNNTSNGATGNSPIQNVGNASPLFVSPVAGNFYLAAGIALNANEAIDASLNQRLARPGYTAVTNPLGIPPDPIPFDLIIPGQDQFAPDIDRFGQRRVDDPNTSNGLGIFRDLGGIERADFAGPTANLTTPLDGGTEDLQPAVATVVAIDNPVLFTQLIVTLLDIDSTSGQNGIGVDDTLASLVTGSAFVVTQTDITGTRTLVSGTEYTYAYNANTNEAIFTSLTVFPSEARYNILVENNPLDPDCVFDLAGNPLQNNQLDGSTQFDILVTNGVNDAPVLTIPGQQTTSEDTARILSTANGNAITISDSDQFLSNGDVQLTLTATNGSLTLVSTAGLTLVFSDPLGTQDYDGSDGTMVIRGTPDEINAALDRLSFLPSPNRVNDPGVLVGNDIIQLSLTVNDLGEFWRNPDTGEKDDPQTDTGVVTFRVTPVNDAPAPMFTSNPFIVAESTSAAAIAVTGLAFASGSLKGPATADDEVGQTLTYTVTNNSNPGLFAAGLGQPAIDAMGNLTFTLLDSDVNGMATISLRIQDNGPAPNANAFVDTTFVINVTSVNDAPVANDDLFVVRSGFTINVPAAGVLTNDTDVDLLDTLTVVQVNGIPANVGMAIATTDGTVTLNADGSFTYINNGGGALTDTFMYRVGDGNGGFDDATVTIEINQAPIINNQAFSVDENSSVGIVVGTPIATDPNSHALTYSIIAGNGTGTGAFSIVASGANAGQISVNDPSQLNFEVTPAYTLTVQVTDIVNPATEQLLDTATITINLNNLVENLIVTPANLVAAGVHNVRLVQSGGLLHLFTPTNTDIVPAHNPAFVNQVLITGENDFSNTLTIDFSGGRPFGTANAPTNRVVFDGGEDVTAPINDNDTLVLSGGAVTTVIHNFSSSSSGTVVVDGNTVSYTGLEPITDTLTATNRTFNFGATADDITLNDSDTSSDGLNVISSVSSSETVTFLNPTTSLTVNAGNGDDTLRASGFDTTGLAASGVTLNGDVGNDVLFGRTATSNNFTVSTTANNAGTVNGAIFGTIENLRGGSAADTFAFADTPFALSGTIDAQGGDDALDYSAYTTGTGGNVTVVLSASGSGTATRTGGIVSIESVAGGDGNDSLTGSTGNDTLTGNDGNDTLADGAGSDSLNGGLGNDTYVLTPGSAEVLSDNNADSGVDTVDFSGASQGVVFNMDLTTAQFVFGGNTVQLAVGTFESFIGSTHNDTVTATVIANRSINGNGQDAGGRDSLLLSSSGTNTWNIVGAAGSGNINGAGMLTFSNLENLTGGTGNDTFAFAGGSVTGTINGGNGTDTLDYSSYGTPVTVNLQTATATATGGFSNIENFTGNSSGLIRDTLIGTNNPTTWTLTGNNNWSINGGATTPFVSFENLTGGTSTDTFMLNQAFVVTGMINGGTGTGITDVLNYSAYATTSVTIDLRNGSATNINGNAANGVSNIESFVGGTAPAGDSFIGPTATNTWNINAGNTGTISSVLGGNTTNLSYSSFETLGGGSSTDNFIFASGASIGALNGNLGIDTLNLSAFGPAAARNVVLSGTTADGFSGTDAAITNGFTGINVITATTATTDALSAAALGGPLDWTLGTTNRLIDNSTGRFLDFNGFENLTGSLTGNNTFTITNSLTANLTVGSGGDTFILNDGVVLTGTVSGGAPGVVNGNDTLSFTNANSAQTVTLTSVNAGGFAGTTAAITGGFSGINTLVGGNGFDTLIGLDQSAIWTVDTTRTYTVASGILEISTFENLTGGSQSDQFDITGTQSANLIGGAGDDTFNFADGASITGNLIGGIHVVGDTVSYAGNSAPVSVNLNNLNSIETVIGGGGNDTLIGLTSGSTFNITGPFPDSGTVGGIVFQDFQNLTGSGSADTFNLTDTGVLTGVIDGGLGVDVLSFAAMTTARVVTLTGSGAGDGFNGIEGSITGGFQNINTITGSSATNDQLFGLDVVGFNVAVWAINSTMTYSAGGRTLTFSAFETMTGGTGNDEFTVTGARTGNLHGGVGGGLDTYRFTAGATLTGDIDGDAGNDTLSFEFYTSAVSVTLNENLGDGYGGIASPILSGGFHNIDTLIGGTAGDTLNGINDVAAWEVDGTNRYSTPGSTIDEAHYLFFNSFENLNGGIESDTFVVTGNQTVNLSGNDGDDTFTLAAVSNLIGTINGGNGFDTYDLSAKTTSQTINISNLISIENLNGSLANDTLVGLNSATTFVIDGPNSGTAGTIGFTGFENLQGGTSGDSFEFLDGGSISGTLNGGTGSDALRFTDMSSSQEITLTGLGTNDGFAGNAGATVANFTNIDSVVGSSADVSDTVHGMNVTSTWAASGTGINYTASSRTINLSNVEVLFGGTAVDTFTLNATSTVTSIDAGDNADTINASAATINMTLFGGTGNDTIFSGLGDDEIDGGLGTDEFRQTTDNDQTLTDSSATGMGGDTLASIERALLTGGASGNSIDASGFSFVATLNGAGGNDTIFGGLGNDSINGGGDTDVVSGSDGNDIVDGGNGDGDLVSGGLGNDVLIGGAGVNDRLVEVGLSGNVTLTVSALTSSLGSDTISGFEGVSLTGDSDNNLINASAFTGNTTLDGGAGNDTITGGSGNDNLIGGDDNDTLNGKAGNDTLDGSAGDDVLTGDLGNDQIDGGGDADVLSETGNVNMTLTNTSLVGLGTDSLSNIEAAKLTGGIGNNTINAAGFSAGSVTLLGDAGNDSLLGGSQNDSIDGGAGLDTLRGNGGNDTIRGGTGTDSLDGGDGNDDLNGQAENDTILGGNQNDTITGELGNDSLDGGLGTDRMIETGNVNFVLTAAQLTGVGTDKVLNFESVVLTGGTGNNSINATGFTGSVSLFGLGGNDILTGGSASDLLEGGDGNDQLTGALGNDTLDGGNGTDTLVEAGATTFALTNTTLTGVGSDVLIVIEAAKLTSGAANSTINASAFTAGPVTLTGGAGNDSLLGGSGNDSINGGTAGKDTIRGGDGNDTLNGGTGGTTVGTTPSSALANRDDIIHGDAGNDSILGLGGNDFLFGEAGNDTIDGGDGHDAIDGGDDNDSILGGLGNDAIRGSDGNDTLNGGDGNDCILGGTGADNILGGNGNDVLRGEGDNDTLSGQTGTDSLDGGAGVNTLLSPLGDLQGDFSAIFSDASFNDLISSIP